MHYSTSYDTENHSSNIYEEVRFARNFETDEVRWNRKMIERTTTEKLLRTVTPGTPQYWGGIVQGGVFYNFSPISKTPQGEERNAVVVFKKGERKPNEGNQDFDPVLYTERNGISSIGDTLRYHYKRKEKYTLQYLEERNKEFTIVRNGDIVTWTETSKRTTRSHTFDLAKGGSLIAHENRVFNDDYPESGEYYTWEYTQINGAWVLSKYSNTNIAPQPVGLWKSERTITFHDQKINEAFPENEFTLESLGVRYGTRIIDHHAGISYDYGNKDETTHKINNNK